MDKITTYCGISCEDCLIRLATLETDKAIQKSMRESVVEQCALLYGMNFRLEEITDCDGCRTTSDRLFTGCRQCKVRQCASAKNIESCAFCPAYLCDTLRNHFLLVPESEFELEKLRKN
ncbi:MAG: DUF3795 domain-containing protein [Prolixibacteraceae bacterium]